jgi:hypothetical protein
VNGSGFDASTIDMWTGISGHQWLLAADGACAVVTRGRIRLEASSVASTPRAEAPYCLSSSRRHDAGFASGS